MKYVLPLFVIIILLYGMRKGEVYSDFIKGAEKGLKTAVSIFPAVLAIMSATKMMEASGVFDAFLKAISPITKVLKIPDEIMSLAIIRPFSGGAATGMFSELLNKIPPESRTAMIASVIMGSSETTFYALCVYFKNTGAKYTKKIIPAAILGDIVGLISAVWLIRIAF